MNYSICTYMTKMRHKSRQKVRFFANFWGTPKNFLAKKRTSTNTISTESHDKNSIYAIKSQFFKAKSAERTQDRRVHYFGKEAQFVNKIVNSLTDIVTCSSRTGNCPAKRDNRSGRINNWKRRTVNQKRIKANSSERIVSVQIKTTNFITGIDNFFLKTVNLSDRQVVRFH